MRAAVPCSRPGRVPTSRRRVRTAAAGLLAAAVGVGCTGTSSGQVEVVEPTEPPNEATSTTVPPPDCAEQLPPAAQAGQLLMVMVTAPQLATDVLTSGQVGGFGLKGRQSSEVGQEVTAAVAEAPIEPFVAGDEEGGTVQRLEAALGALSGADVLAEGAPQDAGRLLGDYASGMAELGFDMNFGPVADVGDGADLDGRTFGDDPATVAGFVESIVQAQAQAGITSVVKHWPGIGTGQVDPHGSLGALAPIEQLRGADLTVFDKAFAAGAPAVMVAHATVPGLTADDEPASLSRAAITDELRGRQGFDGLVVTDSLGMGAVVNTIPQDQAAVRAIAAGADVALLSGTDVVEAAHGLMTEAIASGLIPAEQVTSSVRRVLATKGVEGQCLALAAGFSDLQQRTDAAIAAADAEADQDGTGTGDEAVTDSGATDADQGVGSGSGSGDGTGSGSGTGDGTGDGTGSGTGDGTGSGVNGSGTGSGAGTGNGSDATTADG
jgi:beta-N-acetylhexosaminidase